MTSPTPSPESSSALAQRATVDTLALDARWAEGIPLAVAAQQPAPTLKDFAAVRILLAEAMEPVSDIVWDQLKTEILREGWSAEHVWTVARGLLRDHTWVLPGDRKPRWQFGDWFKTKAPRVYGHRWYQEQVAPPTGSASNAPLIGCYVMPGTSRCVWAWRAEADGILEPYTPPPAPRALPPARADVSDETMSMVSLTRDLLIAKERIDGLERRCEQLLVERDRAREHLADAEMRIAALEEALAFDDDIPNENENPGEQHDRE